MTPKTIIHLLSGGLDSTVMLYDLHAQGHAVHCVLFNYKQRHRQELTFARYHCHRLKVQWTTMDIPFLIGSQLTDRRGTYVVPNRNAIMLSLAVNIAADGVAETITYACNKDDAEMFPDCRAEFVEAFNAMLCSQGFNITVCAPYIGKSKWEIAGLGRELGVEMNQTWSCYEGGEAPCGKCPACERRQEALK